MNKKNVIKMFTILLIVLSTLLLVIKTTCYATYSDGDQKTYTPQEFTKGVDGKTGAGEIKTSGDGVNSVKSVGGQIVGVIQVVGTIASVGMLIILGIKYMMGSAEERAEYKKTLFPYFIGAVLIFAATNLAEVIYSWASKL